MDREALAELRIQEVAQIRNGESPEQVAEVLGLNRVTVYRWLTRFANGGYSGLKRKKAPGKPRLLNESQIRSLYYMLVDSTPEQMKLPFALWTVAGVKAMKWEICDHCEKDRTGFGRFSRSATSGTFCTRSYINEKVSNSIEAIPTYLPEQ